ncbi:MAG: gluconokinase [Acidobacteriota bacterium]
MEQPLILALDIGTSSVRASFYDMAAQPLARGHAKIERSLTVTDDGGSEIDADAAGSQVAAAIDSLLEKTSRSKREIKYAAASTFWHSLLGVDESGKPTTPVYSWADTRSGKYTDVLRKRFAESEVHGRTGARFHSSYWPAKLLWLRREHPEIWATTAGWMSLSDYIAGEFFGPSASSISMASGTGIFDIRNCDWDAELLKYLQVKRSSLPELTSADDQTFKLIPKYAKRWPRLAKTCWFPSIADGAADNMGANCTTREKAALMIGTSGAMRVSYKGDPPAKIPSGLWCYRVDRQRVIIGGALSDGGGLYRWLKDTLRLPADAEEQIERRPPGSDDLTFLPFVAGERSTGYNENARGAILGLRSATDPVDILQAAMESVAYRFAEIFQQLSSVLDIREIVASGGALRDSPVWTQIIADVLGRDITLTTAHESSSRGAVLLALESIGKIEGIGKTPAAPSVTVKNRPKNHAAYADKLARHRAYYDYISKFQP